MRRCPFEDTVVGLHGRHFSASGMHTVPAVSTDRCSRSSAEQQAEMGHVSNRIIRPHDKTFRRFSIVDLKELGAN